MKTYVFDLDNTLYPEEKNVFPLIDARINAYMSQYLKIPAEEVDSLRRRYLRLYGATMQGLMHHHGVDPEDFLAYVHDLDLTGVLGPNPGLRSALHSLTGKKVVFTNASLEHALRVLQALDLEDLFEHIFDIRTAGYTPKPFSEPYLEILRRLELFGAECVMVDDLPDNLRTAKELGMYTVLIGTTDGHGHVDCCVPRACRIRDALEKLGI